MFSFSVLALVLSAAAPFLLSFCSSTYSAPQSPIWTFAYIIIFLSIGRLIYSVVLYPIFFTPFKHLPVPHERSLWNGHFDALRKADDGHWLRIWTDEIPNNGLIRFYTLFNAERLLPTSEKAVADILVHKAYDFDKPEYIRFAMSQVAGFGVLLEQGEAHRGQRRRLNPAFSYRHIKDLYPVFWSKSIEMVRAIEKTIQKLPADQKFVRISDWAGRATLDIIGRAAIDLDFGTIQDSNSRLHKEYHQMLQSAEGIDVIIMMIIVFFSPKYLEWLPTKRTRAVGQGAGYIRSLAHGLIQEKKQRIAMGTDTCVDIISVCLKSGDFTNENLTEQLMTFLAAGHETTATMLQWVVYALCKHPDVQRRLRDEIRSQLPSFDSDQGISTLIDRLPYLKAVCNEVLRYYPPVPETERIALRDTIVDGTVIPKGTVIIIGHDATNRNKEFWGPDANEFNPDRWMTPGCANTGGATSNYALMTFIHGPRSCIGAGFAKAEMACLVAALVGRFEMELQDPDSKLEITGFATSKPKDGVPAKLQILDGW